MFYIKPRILSSLKNYSREQFKSDLVSGIIVGVVALPLSIAFGIASGVSPEKGITSAIVTAFIVALIGGSRVQITGPTGAFVIIVYGIIQEFGFEGLLFASILAGIIQISMALLKVGTIFKFIPYPVVIGFNSGIALSIFTSQIKDVLGLKYDVNPINFFGKWEAILTNISTFNFLAIIIALVTILLIIYFPHIRRKFPSMLAAVIIVTCISYILRHYIGIAGIETIGDRFSISAAIPLPHKPTFDFSTIEALVPAAFTIAIMGSIVTILTTTVSDGAISDHSDSNTEIFAQGVANIVSPIFGGIPVTGAIARTMTNINNGGRTPIAGIVHSVTLLAILLFLGSLVQHIPTACLAGMLVIVSYNMADLRTFRSLFKNPRPDVIVLLTTFFLTVAFNLTVAIEIGIFLAIILFMHRITSTSNISVLRDNLDLNYGTDVLEQDEKLHIAKGVEVYEIEGPFFFGIANKFDQEMHIIGDRPVVRIIRMRKVPFIDATGLHNLELFVRNSQREKIIIILSGVNDLVLETLERTDFDKSIGRENIFDNIIGALAKANEIASKIYSERMTAKKK